MLSKSPSDARENIRELAAHTIQRTQAELSRHKRSPASIAQIVELVRDLSSNPEDVQVDELAETIGRDLSATERVIRAANTIGNNPTGTPVKTLSHAILVVGFEQIRSLSISLLMMERIQSAQYNDETKEVAAMALASGLISTRLMEQIGSQDPEQAFVCASLRNYGKLIMSSFFIEEYRQACELAKTTSPDLAFIKIFGLTPPQLAYCVLSNASLPQAILQSINEIPRDKTDQPAQNPTDELTFISEFAVKLCESIDQHRLDVPKLKNTVSRLAKKFGQLDIPWETLKSILSNVDEQLTLIKKIHGASAISSSLLSKLKAVVLHNESAPPASPVEEITPDAALSAHKSKETPLLDSWQAGLEEMNHLLEEDPVDLHSLFATAVKTLHSALHLDSCVLFLKKGKENEDLFVPMGSGYLFNLVQDLDFSRHVESDLLSMTFSSGNETYVRDAGDPEFANFIPKWMADYSGNKACFFLPLKEKEKTFGVLLLTSKNNDEIDMAESDTAQLKILCRNINMGKRLVPGAIDSMSRGSSVKIEF